MRPRSLRWLPVGVAFLSPELRYRGEKIDAWRQEHPDVELTVDLPAEGVGRLRRLLRAVARGDVTVLLPRLGRSSR